MPRLGRAWIAAPGGLLAALILLTGGAAHGATNVASSAAARVSSAAAGASSSAGVSCVPAKLNVSASLAGGRLTVSPAPAIRDASATTQISLLGQPAADIQQLVVRGSQTGIHAGRLAPFSQGDGASFLPAQPFAEGETVSVSARLVVAEGAPPVPVSWSFTTASRPTITSVTPSANATGVAVATTIAAAFNQPVTGATVAVTDPAGSLVAGSSAYNTGTNAAEVVQKAVADAHDASPFIG